ncbi:hypothetical protein GKZ89_07095 [Bacillus mangrovi]|uniref:DUF1269 domain-containing protein n=1 Tax=Metabacillus mangrovi TaxID=1491830 RepID=A0A7X2V4I9_9BACI|nr:hypothetical protein [Metabacillus mangrovi]MTH53176.1 hypothetical protein [Metabacillus mangrovi]
MGTLNYLFSTFPYSSSVELVLTEIEKAGVPSKQILAVPLHQMKNFQTVLDTDLSDDGKSLLDLAAVAGSIFMLLGVIYGLVLPWGPVIWGIIGLAGGTVSGFILEFLYKRRKQNQPFSKQENEIILMVCVQDSLIERVRSIMKSHGAKGLGFYQKMEDAGTNSGG